MKSNLDLSKYNHTFSLQNKLSRLLWNIIHLLLFRPFGSRFLKKWRVLVLKCFGAKIEWSSHVYASVKIWAPWNLVIGANSTLGPNVDCYNQGKITIGSNTIVSQKVYLCASTHDYSQQNFPLVLRPIVIGSRNWIAAGAFIGPSIIIGDDNVIAAKAVVVKNIESKMLVGGNPAKLIKKIVNE